jgi:beta-lactamase class D
MRWIIFVLLTKSIFSLEEHFLLLNPVTDEVILQVGEQPNARFSPASTFKIALSLMGYDSEILKDEKLPLWPFQEGYVADRESWKSAQTPESWMKTSCVWYSQILTTTLGLDKIQNYLSLFEYGNEDMSGGLTSAWLGSSLKISPLEQAHFIQRMVQQKLSIHSSAIEKTKTLLFLHELENDWKLFGKRGLTSSSDEEIGWFIGWIEKGEHFFPFAYTIHGLEVEGAQMIPRVLELLLGHFNP